MQTSAVSFPFFISRAHSFEMMVFTMRSLTAVVLCIGATHAFLTPQGTQSTVIVSRISPPVLFLAKEEVNVELEATLDDEKVTKLFAWVSRAFAGDQRYNDLMLALAAAFGTVPQLQPMLDEAMEYLADEHEPVGAPYSLQLRESASMGAMGADEQ
jgi:hypothetical protein